MSGGDTLDGSELELVQVASMRQAFALFIGAYVAATVGASLLGFDGPAPWVIAFLAPVGMALSKGSSRNASLRLWAHKLQITGRIGQVPWHREQTLKGPVAMTFRRTGRGVDEEDQKVALFDLLLTDAEGQEVQLQGVRCTSGELESLRHKLLTVGRHLTGPGQDEASIPDELERMRLARHAAVERTAGAE